MRRALLPSLLLAACAHVPPPPAIAVAPGTLLDERGAPVDDAVLVERARSARYVLLGEGHDVGCDHRVQGRVIAELVAAGLRPTVGLEMVADDRQPVLDRLRDGTLAPGGLAEALDWKQAWGVPYDLYEPALRPALDAGLPLVALNLPRELVRKAGRQGVDALAPEERARLPSPILPAPPAQDAALDEALAAHPATDEPAEARRTRFLLVQSLWDTQLARAAVEAGRRHGTPVVVLAGAGHVVNGHGIEHRLRTLDPGAEVLSLAPWRGEEPIAPGEADLRFYCPQEKPKT